MSVIQVNKGMEDLINLFKFLKLIKKGEPVNVAVINFTTNKNLMEIVLDYLQFEESIILFRVFKCKEPIRPTLPLPNLENPNTFATIIRKTTSLIKANIHIKHWYIPYSEGRDIDGIYDQIEGIIEYLHEESLKYRARLISSEIFLHLQCPRCGKYNNITVNNGGCFNMIIKCYSTIYYRGSLLRDFNDDSFCQSFCKCIYLDTGIGDAFIETCLIHNFVDFTSAYQVLIDCKMPK